MTPGLLGLVAGLVLSAVFVAAGVGKLTDRAGTRKAVGEFGARDRLMGPLALLLPAAELAVAVALLFATTRGAGAVGALGLLAVFSAAIGVSLARGRTPDCHCFGQLQSAPASWKTLVRNALLAVLAVVALVEHGPGAFGWIGNLAPVGVFALAMGIVAVGMTVGGGLAFVSLLRSHGRVLLRLDTVESALRDAGIDVPDDEQSLPALGIDPGTRAPAFTTETASGSQLSLDNLLEPGLPLLLLFTSPSCGPCKALLPDISRWQQEHRERLTLATVTSGDRSAIRAEAEEHALERVLIDQDLALYETYQANGTPSAVLITGDGQIASYLAFGSGEIEQLVERALAGDEREEGLPIGTPAPELDLRDLQGEPVSLTDPDSDTLLLFWNPGCGYCQSILPMLLAWEQEAHDGAPRLVVVSSGDTGETAEDGFRSTTVLDPEFKAGRAFAAGGTPMGVVVDADGTIASPLLAGGDAVLARLADVRAGRCDPISMEVMT